MAKLIENEIEIKLSKMIRNTDPTSDIIDDTIVVTLEEILKELVGSDVLIEIGTKQ